MPDINAEQPAAARSRLRLIKDFIWSYTLFWIPVGLFLALANAVRSDKPLPGDVPILQALYAIASPALNTLFIVITELGSAVLVIPAILLISGLLYKKHRRGDALFLLFSAGGTAAINVVFKLLFARDRPALWEHLVVEHGYSFPSGHAMISSAVAVTAILLLWHTRYRYIALVAGLLYTLLVGLSRLYLGVHYPSDVLAGWIVSFVWVLTLYKVFNRYRSYRDKRSLA